jgi:hypothetical protein
MGTLKNYMNESKLVSRTMILVVGLIGMFAGAILMFMFAIAGML